MVQVIEGAFAKDHLGALADMHRVRKAVFVDRLGWDLKVDEDGLEIDQFDAAGAVYLIDADPETGRHNASVRLLPTLRPHVLGDLFDFLCEDGAPRALDVWEISRLCTSPSLAEDAAAWARRRVCLGLIEYGLLHGISRYSCVINIKWLSGFIRPGWACEPLGPPQQVRDEVLGAFAISVTPMTRRKFLDQWGFPSPILAFPEQRAA